MTVSGRFRRSRVAVVALIGLAGAGLTACNSADSLVVPTTVVAPPAGCDTSRVIVIGASLDLSGPGSVLGHQYLKGLEMGIAKVNKGNGVPPRNSCFELAYKDNRGNPAIDNQAMLDLVNVEKAGIVVGSFLGAATANYLGGLGVPAISLSSLAQLYVPKHFPNTYPMVASMESQAFAIGQSLKKDQVASVGLNKSVGTTSVGLIVTNDVASRQGEANFAKIAAKDHYRISARATVSPSGAGAAAAVAQVKASHPKTLVILDDAGAVGAVLKARVAAGWHVPVIAGPTATTTPVLDQIAGDERGVSVEVPQGAIAGSGPGAGGTFSFRKQLAAELGGTIHGSIIPYAETYDAMTMMGNAAVGAMSVVGTQITTFLENANYQGVLASYTYTSGAHTGISASNQSAAALDSLSNGLLQPPPKPKKVKAAGL